MKNFNLKALWVFNLTMTLKTTASHGTLLSVLIASSLVSVLAMMIPVSSSAVYPAWHSRLGTTLWITWRWIEIKCSEPLKKARPTLTLSSAVTDSRCVKAKLSQISWALSVCPLIEVCYCTRIDSIINGAHSSSRWIHVRLDYFKSR